MIKLETTTKMYFLFLFQSGKRIQKHSQNVKLNRISNRQRMEIQHREYNRSEE